MNDDQTCRICFTASLELSKICSEVDEAHLNIRIILQKYLSLEIKVDDYLKNICSNCWCSVENFHTFYLKIQIAQKNYDTYLKSKIGNIVNDVNLFPSIVRQCPVDQHLVNIVNTFHNIDYVNAVLDEVDGEAVETDGLTNDGDKLNDSTLLDEVIRENGIKLTDDINFDLNNLSCIDFNDELSERLNTVCKDDSDKQTTAISETKPKIIENLLVTSAININTMNCNEDFLKIVKPPHKTDSFLNYNKNMSNVNNGNYKNSSYQQKSYSLESLEDDMKILSVIRLDCTMCSENFLRFTDLRKHYQNLHNQNGFVICCNVRFYRRCRLLEHIFKHLNPNAYKCDICKKTYASKTSLVSHMDSHKPQEDKKYKCNFCTSSFVRKFQFNQHLRQTHQKKKEKEFLCKECDKRFISNSILQANIRRVHDISKHVICEICAKVCKSIYSFKKHCKVHEESSRVECNICGLWLKNKPSLQCHLVRHKQSGETFICDICGKDYPNSTSLRSHKYYVHLGKRSHKCGICTKAFRRSITLREHITIHTGEVLYRCDYCPTTFNSKANRCNHMRKYHL